METNTSPQSPLPPPAALTPSEERTLAMLAHLSILLNLITGILGPVGALVVYLVYQERSRYVSYHALQSLIFQLIVWLGGGALAALAWAITAILSVIVVGIFCIPFALLVSLIPVGGLIYGVVGGIQCSQGRDFRYCLVGDWVRGMLTG